MKTFNRIDLNINTKSDQNSISENTKKGDFSTLKSNYKHSSQKLVANTKFNEWLSFSINTGVRVRDFLF